MGERAWRRLTRENDWSDVAERTLALYEAAGSRSRSDTPDRSIEVVSHR